MKMGSEVSKEGNPERSLEEFLKTYIFKDDGEETKKLDQ
jgi:hypothetical protein